VAGLRPAALSRSAGAGVLSALCGIGLLATSGWLITRASERPPVLSLCIAIGAVQAFSLGRGLSRYLQRLSTHGLSLGVLGRLRLHLWDTLVPLVPGGLGRSGRGVALSAFVGDTEVAAEGLSTVATVAVDVGASIVLGTVVAVLVAPVLGVCLLCGAATVVAVASLATRTGRDLETRVAEQRAELADFVSGTVLSARELVAFGRHDIVQQRLDEAEHRSARLERSRAWSSGLAKASVAGATGAVVLAVTAVALSLNTSHRVAGVMVAVVVFTALAVMDQCSALPQAMARANSARASVGRLLELGQLPVPAGEPTSRQALADEPPSARLIGVTTIGTGGSTVLNGVTLEAKAGQRLGLIGPSGSGKTSAIYALLRFMACSSGIAKLGGNDVSQISRSQIASLAGWVPDEPHVFAASLRDNLRVARTSASDPECLEALERAGLAGWASGLPAGLETRLGAGGLPVSAGERQRVGLARALLAGSPVLLLDEPTSRLDQKTAEAVLPELLDAAGRRCVLVVSHDPWLRDHVDDVVCLNGGSVVPPD